MLKATGGGGGIGMQPCAAPRTSSPRPATGCARLAGASFGTAGVFLERYVEHARHVEVQVFGDGEGRVVSLGDRDCSLQRRHQKVVEEAPAPDLPDALRAQLHRSRAAPRARRSDYRSAGTVEFVYDAAREEASFLEVNTRLQVEHPVTEAVTGVDLVEWMLRLAQRRGATCCAGVRTHPRHGHAVEARLYAEDPARDFRPSAGLLTNVAFPDRASRVDAWVETGSEVSTTTTRCWPRSSPPAPTAAEAFDRLGAALARPADRRHRDQPRAAPGALDAPRRGPRRRALHRHARRRAATRPPDHGRAAGPLTTVQDWPGRTGYWQVGVPPSRPDGRPVLPARQHARWATTKAPPGSSAPCRARRCASPTPRPSASPAPPARGHRGRRGRSRRGSRSTVPAGGVLDVGTADRTGPARPTSCSRAAASTCPQFLGSASTFTLGRFGGHGGRGAARRATCCTAAARGRGDAAAPPVPSRPTGPSLDRRLGARRVVEGPHARPGVLHRARTSTSFYAAG